jgi:hypothetical protein
MENLSRAALGHVASLGDLYDARTDNFTNTSIFNQKIPESAVTICDSQGIDYQFIKKDTYSDKFSKLGVKAELQVLNLQGWGKNAKRRRILTLSIFWSSKILSLKKSGQNNQNNKNITFLCS